MEDAEKRPVCPSYYNDILKFLPVGDQPQPDIDPFEVNKGVPPEEQIPVR